MSNALHARAPTLPAPWYRWKRSTWMAMLLAAGLLTLANWPGEPMPQPYGELEGIEVTRLHGWPWTYLRRHDIGGDVGIWGLFDRVVDFDGLRLAADCALALALCGLVVVACEAWARRRRAHALQFGLKSIFAAFVGCALLTAWWSRQGRWESERIKGVTPGAAWSVSGVEPRFPDWLREAVGDKPLLPLRFNRPTRVDAKLPKNDGELVQLQHIVDCFPSQVRLYLDPGLTAADLERLSSLSNLEWLMATEVDDRVLATLGRMSGLRWLVLWPSNRSSRVTEAGLAHLRSLPRMESLYLRGEMPKGRAWSFLESLPRLESLGLDCRIDDEALANIAKLPALRALKVRGDFTNDGLSQLAALKKLSWLDLAGATIDRGGLAQLEGLTRLEYLNLFGTNTDDDDLSHLWGMQRLKTLNLDGPRITDRGLQHLNALHALSLLTLDGSRVEKLATLDPKALPHLQHLGLQRTVVSDTTVAQLRQAFPALKTVDYQSEKPMLADLARQVAELRSGTSRHLSLTSPKAGNAQVGRFSSATGIVHLDLQHSHVSDAGLTQLRELKNLVSLCLSATDVEGPGLATLGRLPQLKELWLDRTPVRGRDLRHLAGAARLEFLVLDKSQVDKDALRHLRVFPSLKRMLIYEGRGRKQLRKEAEEVRQALPGIDVSYFDSTCLTPDPMTK